MVFNEQDLSSSALSMLCCAVTSDCVLTYRINSNLTGVYAVSVLLSDAI